MIVVRDSDYVTDGFRTLKEAVEFAECLKRRYPTSAIKIEGHEFGDLALDGARAIVDYEESKMNILELTDHLADLGWKEECINLYTNDLYELN